MMKSSTKMHIGGALTGALLLVLAVLAPLVSAGYIPHWNEKVLDLEAETSVLDTVTDADYEVTYVYYDEDDKAHDVTVAAAAVDVTEQSLNYSTDAAADLRVISVDLSLDTNVVTGIDWDDVKEPYLLIEFPEKSKILWNETVRHWCAAFGFESGNVAADDDSLERSITFEIGAGDATLTKKVLSGDEEGVATSAKAGTCLDIEDVGGESSDEFGAELDSHDVMAFLNEAYIAKHGDEPKVFFAKINGVRPKDHATTPVAEGGDIVDIGFQLYSYPDGEGMTYASIGNVQLVNGLIVLAFALVATTAFNVPWDHIKPNSRRMNGGA